MSILANKVDKLPLLFLFPPRRKLCKTRRGRRSIFNRATLVCSVKTSTIADVSKEQICKRAGLEMCESSLRNFIPNIAKHLQRGLITNRWPIVVQLLTGTCADQSTNLFAANTEFPLNRQPILGREFAQIAGMKRQKMRNNRVDRQPRGAAFGAVRKWAGEAR